MTSYRPHPQKVKVNDTPKMSRSITSPKVNDSARRSRSMSPLVKVNDLTNIGQDQGHKQGQTPKGTPSEAKILKATMTV